MNPRENRRFRAHARKAVSLEGSVSHAVAGWRYEVHVKDLSLCGARAELATPDSGSMLVGEKLTLVVKAPTLWDPVEFPATVIWSRAASPTTRAAFGLMFEGSPAETTVILFDLIASLDFDSN